MGVSWMDWLDRKKLYIYYTLFHTLGYYVLLYFWQNNEVLKTTGENLPAYRGKLGMIMVKEI
jgi:hypothetical protein